MASETGNKRCANARAWTSGGVVERTRTRVGAADPGEDAVRRQREYLWAVDILTPRALNRATLHRQLLLDRAPRTVDQAVSHLVGMQAQNPLDPYIGLWARLEGFDPLALGRMTADGRMVRAQFMRGTVHLFTAEDSLAIHPLTADVLKRVFNSTQFAKDLAGIDMDQLLAQARLLMEDRPRTRLELGRELGSIWPDYPPVSLAQAATYLIPVLQVPPRGVWGEKGQARWTTFDRYLRRPYGPAMHVDDLVIRYLTAFGPAAVRDMRVWSGLTGLGEVFERLRPRLRTYRDEGGAELFDLPDIELPDPDIPAPPRLLAEYDNVLLGHSDRSRFFVDERSPPGWAGNVLVDGVFAGSWKVDGPLLEVSVTPRGLSADDALSVEAQRLVDAAWHDEISEIRLQPQRN